MTQTSLSLKTLHTFGAEAFGREIHFIRSEDDLQSFFGLDPASFYILGGGSNILPVQTIDRVILRNEIRGKEIIHEDEESVTVRIAGGEDWDEFVQWALDQSWSGMENLSLIPGTVGAAPVQNIGAYGVELKEIFVRLEGVLLTEGKAMVLNKEACRFGYRDSVFKQELSGKFFITRVHLRLNKKFNPQLSYGNIAERLKEKNIIHPDAHAVSGVVREIRRSKLPDVGVLGSAGSFFKNPVVDIDTYERIRSLTPEVPHYPAKEGYVKIPAGWLIEQCGWKGRRIGDVGCYEKQALVIVNYGDASGSEILAFAGMIIEDVKSKFGITLTPEVNVWR